MLKNLKILSTEYLEQYKKKLSESPIFLLQNMKKKNIQVDYFQFYNSVSSVYSSKIEGEEIDFDSFFKHKFMKIKFRADYTRKADDLFSAYEFILENTISGENIIKAHKLISKHLLPTAYQGHIRTSPMFVVNQNDEIEYVAADPRTVKEELEKLFFDINTLINKDLDSYEMFYFASLIHLVFVKIHPFQDGNGRTARLIEKWFLIEKLGKKAINIPLEKFYYKNLTSYYSNLKQLGLEYEELDYNKSINFLLMTVKSLK